MKKEPAQGVLIVSGGGDYDDPWHPFAGTSEALHGILSSPGRHVSISTDVARSLTGLSGRKEWDLVVLNVGSAGEVLASDSVCVKALEEYVERGGSLFASHSSAGAFPEEDGWEGLLGGRWVRGTSMHPELGLAAVRLAPEPHPITAGLDDFFVTDERYSYLRVDPSVTVVASHEFEGVDHPLVWAREHGRGRVVYDGLGHDPRSYESEAHRALVAASAAWLLEQRPE